MKDILSKYEKNGLVYSTKHPKLPLTIWNYTEKVQYERLWDNITTLSRGLITNSETGEIVVKPFSKFFNWEEVKGQNVIPFGDDYIHIQEKMDGSLGILFYFKDEWIMSTRGSFQSDQAIRGLEILKSKYDLNKLNKDFSYLVEIIYESNRIVVDYGGEEKIVFLTVLDNKLMNENPELNWTTSVLILKSSGIREDDIVKSDMIHKIDEDLFYKLKSHNYENKEGYVLRFYPSNYRVKIKFEDYIKIHRLVSMVSTTSIWRILSSGISIDEILGGVPDEFYPKIREYHDELLLEFKKIQFKCFSLLSQYENDLINKKEFALWVKDQDKDLRSLLFSMYNGKNYTEYLWKALKPEYKLL
jgi:hypothetical protein